MTFRNALLPPGCDIEWSSAAELDTDVVRTDNGHEKRNINRDGNLARAQIKYSTRSKPVWTALDEFFHTVAVGRGYSFKVIDPRKSVALAGEGLFVSGQAVLRTTKYGFTRDKVITKLHASAVITGGTVNILTGVSPDGATAWTGKFYLCMRFDTDSLDTVGVGREPGGDLIAGQPDVPLIEVLGE